MKKIFCLIIASLFLANQAFAGLISIDVLSGDAGVSYTWFNNSMNAIKNEINGNIDTTNIKARTISEDDFADSVNPRVRDGEQLGTFVYSGLLASAPASGLSLTIPAGTSYTEGYRNVTADTAKTVNASKDTYFYIDINGTFSQTEVANGAAQPTTPANSQILFKAVSDASDITSITDLRVTAPPAIRTYQDYRQGCQVQWLTNATVRVQPGEIDLGASGKLRRNTTATDLDWSMIDTGAEAASTFYYVWAYPSTANDANAMFAISTSSSDATGVSNERLVGWFYNDASSNISADSIGNYIGDGSGVGNVIRLQAVDDVTTASTSYVPLNNMRSTFYVSGKRPVTVTFLAPVNTSNQGDLINGALYIDGAVQPAVGFLSVPGNNVSGPLAIQWTNRSKTLGAGVHTAEVYWKTSANTANQEGATEGGRYMVIREE